MDDIREEASERVARVRALRMHLLFLYCAHHLSSEIGHHPAHRKPGIPCGPKYVTPVSKRRPGPGSQPGPASNACSRSELLLHAGQSR